MPLQGSFGKKMGAKTGQKSAPVSRMRVLNGTPNLEDLRYILQDAQSKIRQPIVMTWKKGHHAAYLLTVTRQSESTFDPTWMLHVDEGFDRTNIVWTYTTSDAELISGFLTEEVNRAAPAAVIPEELKHRAEEPKGKPEAHHFLGLSDQGDGPVIFEHYEILNTIGRGGMGIIYRARNCNDNAMVALKVLRTDLLVDPVSMRRFEHEATAASRLEHPNLIRVREFGLSRFGQPYLTMDFLDGVELQTLLSHCERLDLPMFVNIFTQICDAMGYAHSKGLIHRDLKPGNIMLVKGPTGVDTVKIIDFGIAKILGEENRNGITTTGEMLGSPAYMSPEQCGGVALDSRSDIYSLGCVMYEAISGWLPFRNESAIGTIMMQVNDRPTSFGVLCPHIPVPEELERIIFKAMEKDPGDRYQTAVDLSEDLWAFAAKGYPLSNATGAETTSAETTIEPAFGFQMPPSPKELAEQQAAREAAEPAAPFVYEQNTLNDTTYTLLRKAGILTDETINVINEVEKFISCGVITNEQAVQVVAATTRGIQLSDAVAMLTERKLTLFEALAQLEE
jgi:serine/threonine protein kinase